MCDIHLIVVILVSRWSVRGGHGKAVHTPCEDEKGILPSLRGFTISSISLVEFSLNVSASNDQGHNHRNNNKNPLTFSSN